MNNLDKRILMQVAHKSAVDWTLAMPNPDPALVEETTQIFYEQLLALISKYGTDVADSSIEKSATSTRSPAQDAPEVAINGVIYKDFRGQKAVPGLLDPNHPEFKIGSKGYWLKKQDGSPTKFALDNGLVEVNV